MPVSSIPPVGSLLTEERCSCIRNQTKINREHDKKAHSQSHLRVKLDTNVRTQIYANSTKSQGTHPAQERTKE